MKKMRKTVAAVLAVMMILALASCGGGTGSAESGEEPIQIATKPMTEQYILGEMLKQLIEEKTDYAVEITKGVGGGTSNIHPAMEKGDFDLYPEYTSSGWMMVLEHDNPNIDDEEMFEKLKSEYSEKYQMTWTGLYGFNNTFAIAVNQDVAKQYNLKTGSDLAKVSSKLTFGGNPDYIERADGFHALCDAYGYKFKDVKDIDIGLKYQALEKGDIDVTNGFTTDAQLSGDTVKVLEDDKHYQANYFCSTVVREDTLKDYPQLEETLMLMDGILTDKEMAKLNDQVENQGKEDVDVAREFLISKGLIKK